jgi:hypothetical protein
MQQVYSFIAQKDNFLNLRTADTSVRIAEASRQDSTAMRSISVVTLLFLPATFVAVSIKGCLLHFWIAYEFVPIH